MRAAETEALATGEPAMEMTPLFWQGALGAIGALVIGVLVFTILCFSELRQLDASKKHVQTLADSVGNIKLCLTADDPEWKLTPQFWPWKYYMPSSPSFLDPNSFIDHLREDGAFSSMANSVSCSAREQDVCEQNTPEDVYSMFQQLEGFMNTFSTLEEASNLCDTGKDYGILVSLLCQYRQQDPGNSWPCFIHAGTSMDKPDALTSCTDDQNTAAEAVVTEALNLLPPRCRWMNVPFEQAVQIIQN